MAAPKGKHLFGTVKVGEKGQIVIPKDARNIFGIQPGDSLCVGRRSDIGACDYQERRVFSAGGGRNLSADRRAGRSASARAASEFEEIKGTRFKESAGIAF
jgi:AbrB family looped-hinge helix DNA binding protein